jgi:hypothetical protein
MLRILTIALCAISVWFGVVAAYAATPVPLQASDAKPVPIITLKDGTKLRFVGARAMTPEGGGPESRQLLATFAFEDSAVLSNHARLIEVADILFGGVVITVADTQGYKKAIVGFLVSETKSGDQTVQLVEDFHYARGEDAVWLRQAGPEAWKTAQDPNAWTPPVVEVVDIGDYGKADVTFFGEIAAPPGIKALGIEMRTDTAVDMGRKFEEIRALWGSLDRDKIKADGFNFVMILSFTEKQRGKFHVRKFAFMRIPRMPDGTWAPLPDGPLGPTGQPAVVASLPPMPMPESDAMGVAMTAMLKATVPSSPSGPSVEAAVASGEGLRLRAAGRGVRLKTYKAKTR